MRRNRRLWLLVVTSAIVCCDNTSGQPNPNYVFYNPNLDVYAKPDVHYLAKAITAQNELALTKLAHLGMLPQHIREEGGYKIKGRTAEEADALRRDALTVQEAGAFAVVLEIIVPELAADLSASLAIPTIGIGSGEGCDGNIYVLHDLVGLYPWFRPKFVTPRADLASSLSAAVREYVAAIHQTPQNGFD